MIDQGQNQYLLEVEKLMSSDVISTYWSHNMDLLVIVTVDNLIELYRINFKAQKVFQIQQDKPITAVSFSPDSQFIAYGMNDGEIKVLKTQNGQTLLSVADHINEQIRCFTFVQFGKYPVSKIFPFKQSNILQKLILQIFPHKNCNKSSIVKLNYLNQLTDNDNFTLLLSSSQKHTSLHINGFITIAQINYDMIAAKHFGNDQFTVRYSHYNHQSYKVESVVVQETSDHYVINLVEFDSHLIKQMQPDIIKFNCLLSYISEILMFVEQAYPAAEVLLRDILRQYNQKMNLIDDPDQENINPCNELFKYLNCGMTSTALINFLSKQVYDTKVLQKLDENINSMFNSLHDLLLESIQNSLERAYLLVDQLKKLCTLQKYKVFGVKISDLQKVEGMIEKLYTMGEILLVESTEAKFDIRNLLVWLNKATIKTASDPNSEIENTKSNLSRYTVDFTRLHGFLEKEQKFRMQNLTSFFSKGQQTNRMQIPEREFRLLNKSQAPNRVNGQYISKTKEIQNLLQLQEIDLEEQEQPTEAELNYKSFKLELKQLKDHWKLLKLKPIIQLSKNIQQNYRITKIAQVQNSQIFDFDIKTLPKKNESNRLSQLSLYFIQHSNGKNDQIVEYNTTTKSKRYITVPSSCQALSLAVGVDVILLIENLESMVEQKSIVQVLNEQWKGEQLQVGKRIDNLNGEILIDAGLRGLNLMVVNKNKLVVFD